MQTSPLLTQLMEALRCLPGVGPKSAQRMAFTLLQRDRSGGMRLAQALTRAMSEIGHCADCRTFTEQEVCNICSNPRRKENGQICVVESPADIYAIEQTGQYSGRYFVLMGHLSPLDGIGPDDIGLDRLEQRLEAESITEVMSAILRELSWMPCMNATTFCTCAPPCSASSLAWRASAWAWLALWLLAFTVWFRVSIDAAVCSSALACCSVRALRSCVPVAISTDAVCTVVMDC